MRKTWLISLLLFFVTFAVFSRVLVADFVRWDDSNSIYGNPHVQGLDWERLRWMFTDASFALRYKPLTWLSYALIYQCGGLNPFGYHFANLVLHSVNAVMVFLVIRRLLEGANGMAGDLDREGNPLTFPAAGGALLWAVNPLRVEPVARITDLTYSLLLFFLLLSLWFYLRAYPPGRGRSGRRWCYGCSVASFALSMLSYPFAVGYGIVLLILDWQPFRRFEGCTHWWRDAIARRICLEKIPFLLVGGMAFITFGAVLNPTGPWTHQAISDSFISFKHIMQAFYVWAYFAWKPWFPFHLHPVYPTLFQFNPNAWPFWLSAALVAGTTLLLLWRRRQWPWALALWLCHLVLLLPALGLTERLLCTADRFDYLAGLVWAVIIAAVLGKISARPRIRAVGTVLTIALAVFWANLSWNQTRIWQNSVALFEHILRELGDHPYRSEIHWRLGLELAGQGKTDLAVHNYETSLSIAPSEPVYQAFADLLEKSGQAEGALTNYLALLELGPNPYTHAKAGDLLAQLGRRAEAIEHYRAAVALYPDMVLALNNLAWILATDVDTNRSGDEAVQLAERANSLTKQKVPAIIETLAAAYAEAGRFDDAIKTAEAARVLAESAGDRPLAEKIRKLLELYKAGQPYRELPPSAPPTSKPSQ